jgi:hypothetical protein
LEQRICSGKSTIFEILCELLIGFDNKWHCLYIDNFYSSVRVVEKLLENKIYVCGTLRYNRGEPKDFKSKCNKLKKQEHIILQKNEIFILGYNDKKIVKLISSKHDLSTLLIMENKKKKKKLVCIDDITKTWEVLI